ncbi:MAG: DUF2250 domain-containing protein [Caldisphaeraceae archaeon]|nr:DUF2250 domain-containing protein [Caldisphaeraceae archaeon]MEB3691749.1 DUF2250 domain-containing protein [Caldisphaeraceae archaeon]MEB3797806.1 DUF2250 domain-containing protein [Caldisphaeraceae archaeon]
MSKWEENIKHNLAAKRATEITPLALYILFHLKRANIDYAKSISSMIEVSIDMVGRELERLETLGLVEKHHGSAIKRTEAKFKLAEEVRKHHTYYKLTREGKIMVRGLVRNYEGMNAYFMHLTGSDKSLKLIILLTKAKEMSLAGISRNLKLKESEASEMLDILKEMKLLVASGKEAMKGKSKKVKNIEKSIMYQRTYKATRLSKLLLRYSEIDLRK